MVPPFVLRPLILALAGLVGLAMGGATQAASIQFTVTDLGTLGGSRSEAFDINNLGQVVGSSSLGPGAGPTHGFFWDPSTGVMQDLGDLPGGADNSLARAINDAGQIVGFSQDDRGARAVRWASPTAAIEDLGTARRGGTQHQAYDINGAGEVVGGTGNSNDQRAFFYTDDDGVDPLGDLLGGRADSTAYGLNGQGQVVGVGTATGNQSQAFIWDETNGMRQLIADTTGIFSSEARAINGAGQVVGQFRDAGGVKAFIWDMLTGLQYLGDGSPSFVANQDIAHDINTAGVVVGGSEFGGDGAFVWDETNGIRNLNGLIDPSSGWRLDEAFAINDLGQIVGQGRLNNGSTRAFLLTPTAPVPLPAGVWGGLMGLGALLLLRGRRSRAAV